MHRYGSASAEDLYRLCIRSGALNMPWWELQDDDRPEDDDWEVVARAGPLAGPGKWTTRYSALSLLFSI